MVWCVADGRITDIHVDTFYLCNVPLRDLLIMMFLKNLDIWDNYISWGHLGRANRAVGYISIKDDT